VISDTPAIVKPVRTAWFKWAIAGSASNECREQRNNKNSFASCVFHASSSAMVRLVKVPPYQAWNEKA
jgi:hypothetical protein